MDGPYRRGTADAQAFEVDHRRPRRIGRPGLPCVRAGGRAKYVVEHRARVPAHRELELAGVGQPEVEVQHREQEEPPAHPGRLVPERSLLLRVLDYRNLSRQIDPDSPGARAQCFHQLHAPTVR